MRCIGPPVARYFFVLCILVLAGSVAGAAVNRTIDDVRGDSVTGDLVQYLPQVPASSGKPWFNQTSCAGCADVPDASLSFDNTWSAALYQPDVGSLSVSLKFTGTAIYVFFVIPNFLADSGLASTISCDFFIDSVAVGSFSHQSDGSGAFQYNALVYHNVTVPNGDHVLLIETNGADAAIIIFDSAIYTFNTPDAPPPPVASPPVSHVNIASVTNPPTPPGTSTTSTLTTPSSPIPTSMVAFPTAALSTSSDFSQPFETAPTTSAAVQPFATTPPSLSPAPNTDTDTEAATRAMPVVAIVGAVVGAVILVGLAFVTFLLYRRRRQQKAKAASGTISVFDLLDHTSPPAPPPRQRPHRPRALPTPPMSERGGRSIDATPTKSYGHAEFAGPSMANRGHSTQSSVSGYGYSDASDARSDLHIHIPMTFRPGHAHSPSPLTGASSRSHSPMTRNGVPMRPDQAEIVRELLGSLSVDASERSGRFTPTTVDPTEVGDEDEDADELYVHVDSGVRFSRAMMELPPVYAAS